jgi:AcrR family transcriptional regulator
MNVGIRTSAREGRLVSVAMTNSSSAQPGDRRVRRTQATLQRALIDLVAERDLSQIGVADVADRADVSRSTFYDHYRDVHELAEAACTSMIDDLIGFVLALDPAPGHPSGSPDDPDPALTAFFAHFAEHAGLYRSLLGPAGSARVIEHVRQRTTAAAHFSGHLAPTDDTRPPDTDGSSDFPQDVPAAFVAGALLGVAADWLQRGCPRTPLEMTMLTKPLLAALSASIGTPPTSWPSSPSRPATGLAPSHRRT